ncbi:MAG: hypothetical protein ACR2RF_32200 [Geminicoccaceae bacterium]
MTIDITQLRSELEAVAPRYGGTIQPYGNGSCQSSSPVIGLLLLLGILDKLDQIIDLIEDDDDDD